MYVCVCIYIYIYKLLGLMSRMLCLVLGDATCLTLLV